MENFKLQLLGDIFISSYFAWFILSIIGSVIATLIRNQIPNLKSYPVNAVQLLLGILITFVFIRFSFELTSLVPSAFGAFAIGLGGNELALAILTKFLNKKKQESIIKNADIFSIDSEQEGPGGSNNPKPDPKDK